MAITINSGGAAGSAGAVTSLACGSFNEVNTGRIFVAIVLLDVTKSVTSITHNSGAETFSFIAAKDGAGVRIEYWRCDNPATKTGLIITANLSGSVACAIAAEQYTGDTALLTRGTDLNDTSFFPHARQAMAFSLDYGLMLLGFTGAGGDTITADTGTLRRSAVGSSGAAGVAIVDSTATPVISLDGQVKLNNSREWVSMPVGLQATSTAYTTPVYDGVKPVDGTPGSKLLFITYRSVKMPAGGGGGILPPSGDGQIFPPIVPQGD